MPTTNRTERFIQRKRSGANHDTGGDRLVPTALAAGDQCAPPLKKPRHGPVPSNSSSSSSCTDKDTTTLRNSSLQQEQQQQQQQQQQKLENDGVATVLEANRMLALPLTRQSESPLAQGAAAAANPPPAWNRISLSPWQGTTTIAAAAAAARSSRSRETNSHREDADNSHDRPETLVAPNSAANQQEHYNCPEINVPTNGIITKSSSPRPTDPSATSTITTAAAVSSTTSSVDHGPHGYHVRHALLHFRLVTLTFLMFLTISFLKGQDALSFLPNLLSSNRAVTPSNNYPHILPPHHVTTAMIAARRQSDHLDASLDTAFFAPLTLRDVLSNNRYSLAMAPAFFGFYGYFGALAAWEDALGDTVLTRPRLQAVAGASAGAMAAILLAASIPPRTAADYVTKLTVGRFADFPGLLALFRGNKFEQIMQEFLSEQQQQRQMNNQTDGTMITTASAPIPLLENAMLPVAVSAFDIQTMSAHVLTRGSMARAARASATFPGLFQPVPWIDSMENMAIKKDYLFIDGGIADPAGMLGLNELTGNSFAGQPPVVVNLCVGDFLFGTPPGPSTLATAELKPIVVSVSLRNLPQCGPWAMSNGPKAVDAAHQAMMASLDAPLYHGVELNHYELHIDTLSFWKN